NDILFVGYQGRGTPGRDILKYGKDPDGYVRLDGRRVNIRATVHSMTGYSAHADQRGLLEWVKSIPEKPKQIKLVHGEPKAQQVLAERLREIGIHEV
ncbi:MAG: MBL fold metallo-hydrolase, partial [Deltaproteobacteria bacterium]|nr:MBL fold metallo-hydrolase [Deltaproteobacteria bacterium]